MTKNLFKGREDHPQHISVGALVVNDKGEVFCHKFNKDILRERVSLFKNIESDLYLLMRESLENNETLEDAVHRGLREEFGMKAEIIDYLGSIVSNFKSKETNIEKTTLYFVCKEISIDESSRSKDIEGESDLAYVPIDFLIEKSKQQSTIPFGAADESPILEKLKTRLEKYI